MKKNIILRQDGRAVKQKYTKFFTDNHSQISIHSSLLIILCLFFSVFCSCLQSTVEEKFFEYLSEPEEIISRPFSCDNSDLLIVIIYGGTLESRLSPSQFSLTLKGEKIPLTYPIRADDNCILFSFDKPLAKNSGYHLIIQPQAIKAGDAPKMAVVQAVRSSEPAIVENTGFGNSIIRSVTFGNGYFIATGDSGKMSYSSDTGGNWITVRSGDGDDGNKFVNTIYDIASNITGFYAVGSGARMSWSNKDTGINNWYGHKLPNSSDYGESMFGGREIRAIEYGKGEASGGRFVAAGEGGNVIFRWDLDSWRRGEGISNDNIINTLAWGDTGGDGRFIAGGYWSGVENDQNVNKSCLYWAADGLGTQNWTGADSKIGDNIIRCSAYGNGVFIIGGDSGKLSLSPDGMEWTEITSSPFVTSTSDGLIKSGVNAVTFGSGVFIAAGHDGIMAVSSDGVNWELISPNGFESNEQITSIVTNGRGRFAAAGNRYGDDRSKIVTWYQKPPVNESSGVLIKAERWRVVSSSGMSGSEIRGIAYNGSRYVAVGEGKIAFSDNGSVWSEYTTGKTNWNKSASEYIFFNSVIWADEKFAAVGYWINKTERMGVIAVSNSNGDHWTIHEAPLLTSNLTAGITMSVDPKIYGIAYSNGNYVAVGERGWSAWSTDAVNWNPVWIIPFSQFEQNNNNQDALSVAGDGMRLIVGGTRGKLACSVNGGRSWEWIANGLLDGEYNDILSVAYGNGKFIAAGSNGRMKSAVKDQLNSSSGWQTDNSRMYGNINCVIYGGGQFLAVGNSGSISMSEDGSNWQPVLNSGWNSNENIYSAAAGKCFITGGFEKIIYSEE